MRLSNAGCRDFFVATWAEAEALMPWLAQGSLSVLHGIAEEDLQHAISAGARPVLNSVRQVARWREAAPGRPCDVMVDTGMNRLGLSAGDVADGLLDGLTIETLMSHLASADEDSPMNERQRESFRIAARVPAKRLSLEQRRGVPRADYALD
jgi:alanine racemase